MSPTQKRILLLLLLIAAVYFAAFCFPNAAGSADVNMVLADSPDEAVPLPYVFDMIKPVDTVKQALINFALYDYYFYGYPHFAVSALALLPLALAGRLGDTPLVMVTLRQVVSVLPMLMAVLWLVYLQTRFRSTRAVVLFVFLLSVPALAHNNLWWHPDSLAILFAVGAIFFLTRDDLRFGGNFYLSAAMCGVSAQIKGIGFYFFLAVFVYLLIGFFGKKASPGRLALASAGFLLVMAAAYFAANPILIYPSIRARFFERMIDQARMLREGYEVAYATGLQAAWPQVREKFGEAVFLLTALAAAVWGAVRGPYRLLSAILLAWAVPLTVMAFFLIHFKPQYWLPVTLPLFSGLAAVLPDRLPRWADFRSAPARALPWLVVVILAAQFGLNVRTDVQVFHRHLTREATSPAIAFGKRATDRLTPLDGGQYRVYHEVRMYLPPRADWTTESAFAMLDYGTIQDRDFDVVMVMQQRIDDYLNPNVEAIDAEALARSRVFYRDANEGTLQGYTLVFRDEFGLIFVKDALYASHFAGAVPEAALPSHFLSAGFLGLSP